MKKLASIVVLTLMASIILPSQCVFAQNDKISVFVNGNLSVLEKAMPNFSSEDAEVLGENLDNVKWYVTDDSLVMYYNSYEVAPYAVGYPTVEIKLDNNALGTDVSVAGASGILTASMLIIGVISIVLCLISIISSFTSGGVSISNIISEIIGFGLMMQLFHLLPIIF